MINLCLLIYFKIIDQTAQIQEELISTTKLAVDKDNKLAEIDNIIAEVTKNEQMFQFDSDSLFDSMQIEDYNGNNNIIGLGQIKDSEECWIPEPAEIYSELPENLYNNSQTTSTDIVMDKAEVKTLSPSPVAVVKKEEENIDFDLINYIIGDVSTNESSYTFSDDFITFYFSSKQEVNLNLTPLEEKSEPIFVNQPLLKVEPTTDTSYVSTTPNTSANSRTSSYIEETTVTTRHNTRRRVPKRRYSSDSDFSVSASVSSYNSTSKKQKKRGRPAKELITELPTIDDFKHIPVEEASHLVLRIKNNEASRKSRMKSKSKQDAMEDECVRLVKRRRLLEIKKNKYDGQIETLRRWLLGQN